jgi:protein-L-isoaspartate O-methyltransferase
LDIGAGWTSAQMHGVLAAKVRKVDILLRGRAGTGRSTAALCALVGPTGSVCAWESCSDIAAGAKEALRSLHSFWGQLLIPEFRCTDCFSSAREPLQPFDVAFCSASCPNPQGLQVLRAAFLAILPRPN